MIQPATDVPRRAMVLVAALVAGLAVLMLGGPPASADARLVGQHHAVVATADHAVAAVSSPGRHGAEALPPARHHHVKPCILPHRGGGRPLLSASGRVAMFVASPRGLTLLPRSMADTAAPPGRFPTTYPMRT